MNVEPAGPALKAPSGPVDRLSTMEQRQERILLETGRHRMAGTVTLARDGYRSRISDLMNATDREFLSLTDVTIEALGADGPGTHHDFVVVARRHVVFAIPLDGATG